MMSKLPDMLRRAIAIRVKDDTDADVVWYSKKDEHIQISRSVIESLTRSHFTASMQVELIELKSFLDTNTIWRSEELWNNSASLLHKIETFLSAQTTDFSRWSTLQDFAFIQREAATTPPPDVSAAAPFKEISFRDWFLASENAGFLTEAQTQLSDEAIKKILTVYGLSIPTEYASPCASPKPVARASTPFTDWEGTATSPILTPEPRPTAPDGYDFGVCLDDKKGDILPIVLERVRIKIKSKGYLVAPEDLSNLTPEFCGILLSLGINLKREFADQLAKHVHSQMKPVDAFRITVKAIKEAFQKDPKDFCCRFLPEGMGLNISKIIKDGELVAPDAIVKPAAPPKASEYSTVRPLGSPEFKESGIPKEGERGSRSRPIG